MTTTDSLIDAVGDGVKALVIIEWRARKLNDLNLIELASEALNQIAERSDTLAEMVSQCRKVVNL